MKIEIEEIYSRNMFPGLIMGKPKDGMYQKSLDDMKELLGDHYPITNNSEVKWTQIKESNGKEFGYGTWGHITGVKCRIREGDDNYSFSLIFNFCPEIENLEDKLTEEVSKFDYKNNSLKWDIGDL
jgi:hypothetical protein